LARIQKSDIGQGLQGRRQQAGAHVDTVTFARRLPRRVEDFHLVGDLSHVHDFGQVGMKSLQRAAWLTLYRRRGVGV
jgi:hypothetical protein